MLVAYPVKTIEVAIQMLGEDGTESLLAKLDLLKE